MSHFVRVFAFSLLLVAIVPATTQAQDGKAFFEDKTVTDVAAIAAGGYDMLIDFNSMYGDLAAKPSDARTVINISGKTASART